ncbi:hypothetical protein ACJMK2_012187 [Sinanodonta woodiana]|uniref:Mab-21-like HhH/H2TH-like domain-containing protein n=1 Tax=Sinanodonta woodiana TaxID=1069815 RepID=A0ABD3VAH5_SINWO
MTLNIPEYYKEVSLRLNRVLDTVGLGEDIRWQKINIWIQTQKMQSVIFGDPRLLGSQVEATTTPRLQSDIDVIVPMSFTVIQNLESWVPENVNLLVVSDENTPPGYVKLQVVRHDLPLPIYNQYEDLFNVDRYDRSVLCNEFWKLNIAAEHHGPANTEVISNRLSIDTVFAARLHTWPYKASAWLTRNRCHNWPSQRTIDLIQQTGALLVPVGHKASPEEHLEWRLSISFGEKLLVWLFNSTQYKCYVLLKMINKSFITPVVGNDVLSSYHCKTCIFYLLENTPTTMWQPDNLLLCVEMCLRLLYTWTESKNCPNYFIPDENMFQCKVYGHVQGRLLDALSNLLNQEGRYLTKMSCDRIGLKLVRTCQSPFLELELETPDVGAVLGVSVYFQLFSAGHLVCDPIGFAWLLFSQEVALEVKAFLRKFYCSNIGSKLASISLSSESPDQRGLDIAHELLVLGSSSDVTSGKLKLAAFYLVLDNLDMCEGVLNEIRANYTYTILYPFHLYQPILEAKLNENLTVSEIISHCTSFPIAYEPLEEMKCIPKALIPEMFRTTGFEQDDPYISYTKNIARIDAKVYLHFMEFLCYYRQNKTSHKQAALDNIIFVIQHEPVQFEDTALNLLAYCLRLEGRIVNAHKVLLKSMKLKNGHNAAKWHISTFINAAFRFLRDGQC